VYEKILVPLDGSELAEVALPYVETLAGKLGSEITLLHVCDSNHNQYDHMHNLYMEKVADTVRQGAEKRMDKSEKKPLDVKPVILNGHAAEQIVDYADKNGIGMILLTTHGRSGIKGWLLGSVATKVLKATRRPVAIIRSTGTKGKPKRISAFNKLLVPLDGVKKSEAVIPYVEKIALGIGAEVVLLHIFATVYPGEFAALPYDGGAPDKSKNKATDYLSVVGRRLEKKGIKTSYVTEFGPVAEQIIRQAKEIKAGMVVMSTGKRRGLKRWTLGSTVNVVLHEGKAHVMLIRS